MKINLEIYGGDLHQLHLALESTTTVAPFRAWRGLQFIVAREPMQITIDTQDNFDKETKKMPYLAERGIMREDAFFDNSTFT